MMTEKRFTIDYPSLGVFDNKTQKIYKINPIFEEEDLIDLLNSLVDENEQLRKELEKLKLLNESLGLFMNE